jgi:hypothetical protein
MLSPRIMIFECYLSSFLLHHTNGSKLEAKGENVSNHYNHDHRKHFLEKQAC